MSALADDLKYGLRTYKNNLPATGLALVTLALSIGACITVFSVVDALLLKPLPYRDAEHIVMPWRLAPKQLNLGYDEIPWGISEFHRIQQYARTIESLAAFKSDLFNLTGAGEAALLEGERTSAQFFHVLGVSPEFGRYFTREEDQPGHEHEVVLSHRLWQERFHGDHGILGRTLDLNGEPYTVIGVMPESFDFPRGEEMPGSFGFPRRTEIWVPLALPVTPAPNSLDELALIGRVKNGVSMTLLQQEMNLAASSLDRDFPDSRGWFNCRVTALTKQVTGGTCTPLLLTLGAVCMVLLIACLNLASFLLARSLGRGTELALRAALGAGRGRLVRQLLTESLMLAMAGGAAGLLLASIGIDFVKAFAPVDIPRLQEAAVDPWVIAFAAGITLISGILFGLAPALAVGREHLTKSLKEGGRGAVGSFRGRRFRNVLLIAEVALTLVLLIASGLLVRTFLRLLSTDPGFETTRVLTFELSLPKNRYQSETQVVSVHQKVLDRLRATPGVDSAALVDLPPMDGTPDATVIRVLGRSTRKNENPLANYTIVSPGYFSTLHTAVLRGRDFLATDSVRSTPVTVINRAMARKFWPGENPIGQQIGLGSPAFPPMTIVGIVADIKHLSLRDEPGPQMYVPFTQRPFPSMLLMHFVVRSKADPAWLVEPLRAAVHTVDAGLPVAKITTLQTLLEGSVAGQRFSMLILSAFAAVAMLLASFGMYSVISYSVTHRTREIGIRIALGAERRNVLSALLGQGIRLACVGLAIGLAIASAVTHSLTSFLFGVQPVDIPTFACVTLFLLSATALGCYLPARRATQIDPIVALRCH